MFRDNRWTTIHYPLYEFRFQECPASFITPRTYELVHAILRASAIREEAGISGLGSDVEQWPGWFYDAVSIIQTERRKTEEARFEAQQSQLSLS